MPSFSSIVVAASLLQTATSSRIAMNADLVAAAASANTANKTLEGDPHPCCTAHQYDSGHCPCKIMTDDKDLREAICAKVRSEEQVTPARNCESLQYKPNLDIMRCNLMQSTCIKCKLDELKDACQTARTCESLKSNEEEAKKICEALRERKKKRGIIMTPYYVSKILNSQVPQVKCTEKDLIDMCGVQQPCPTIMLTEGKREALCASLKNKISTLKDVSMSLTNKGHDCSPEDVSAICVVKAPAPPSPCPEFTKHWKRVKAVCSQIHNKQPLHALAADTPGSYQAASELLKSQKSITCSAEQVASICVNVIKRMFKAQQES